MSLTNAKVGDVLIVSNRWNEYIEKVVKITPKGSVKTERGSLFTSDGRKKGTSSFDIVRAEIATKETLEILANKKRKSNLSYRLSEFKWSELNLKELEQVNNLIEELACEAD